MNFVDVVAVEILTEDLTASHSVISICSRRVLVLAPIQSPKNNTHETNRDIRWIRLNSIIDVTLSMGSRCLVHWLLIQAKLSDLLVVGFFVNALSMLAFVEAVIRSTIHLFHSDFGSSYA